MLLLVPPANFANAQGERPVVCQDLTLDFDGLAHGAPLGNRDGTDPGTIHAKLVPFGIRASAMAMDPQTQPPRGVNTLIVYDSHFLGDRPDDVGEDSDLEHPFDPPDKSIEGVPIVPDNVFDADGDGIVDSPNDWAKGGWVTYEFDHSRTVNAFTGVDDLNPTESVALFFSDKEGNIQIAEIAIDKNTVDRGTHKYDNLNIDNVQRVEFHYSSSGGITNIETVCPPVSVCDNLPTPDVPQGVDIRARACIEGQLPTECLGVTSLTVEYTGEIPAGGSVTITATDKKIGTLKTVTISESDRTITVDADDVPNKDKLPPNTIFTITIGDESPVDFIVADDGRSGSGGLIRVDPITGEQTFVSFGGLFVDPEDVALDADGNFIVADDEARGGNGAIIRVDPLTGDQTEISSGGLFVRPQNLIFDAENNRIIVTDDGRNIIIAVDPAGDQGSRGSAQTLISDDDLFDDLEGVFIDTNGDIIVVDGDAGTGAKGALLRVDSAGVVTVISSDGFFVDPEDVIREPNGDFIVADGEALGGAIIRVDPAGDQGSPGSAQTVLSSGGLLDNPEDLALDLNGDIIVADDDAEGGKGALIRVDPQSGAQSVISSRDLFNEPEGVIRATSITQDTDIKIHTSCSTPIDAGDVHGDLTIIALCKIFDNGREQCFTTTGGPYDSLSVEQYVEDSTNNQLVQSSSRNDDYNDSYNQQQNDESYTEPPDYISTLIDEGALDVEEGELTPPEDIPGIVEQLTKYDALSKEHHDMLAKLQQKDVKLDKRLQSLLEKYEDGKYYGPIPEGDQVTKSYSLSLDGSAFPMYDSAVTDFSGEILIETLWTGTHYSKFRVTGGQLIIGDVSYDVIFGKARTSFSTSGDKDSMVILAQLLDQEGNVNTLRISFNSEVSLQEEPSQSINFEITPRSKIAHNWHLSASGQLSLLEG